MDGNVRTVLYSEFDTARDRFDRALELDPSNAAAHQYKSILQTFPGDADDAVRLTPPGSTKPLPSQELKAPAQTMDLKLREAGGAPHSVLPRPAPGAVPIGRATLRRDVPTGALSLSLVLAPANPRGSRRAPTPPGDWQLTVKTTTARLTALGCRLGFCAMTPCLGFETDGSEAPFSTPRTKSGHRRISAPQG